MDILLDCLVTVIAVATLAQYMWSARGHFKSEDMPKGAKLLSGVVLACALLMFGLTWFVLQPIAAQLAGVALMSGTQLLFWAAIRASRNSTLLLAFDPDNPRSLVNAGPYRYVRHPFYVSYVIFWGGWAIATWSIWALLPFVVMTGVYVSAARDEERKFALTGMAADYEAYRRRTGFFFPRIAAPARPRAASPDTPPSRP